MRRHLGERDGGFGAAHSVTMNHAGIFFCLLFLVVGGVPPAAEAPLSAL